MSFPLRAVLLASVFLLVAPNAYAKEYLIKFSHVVSPNSPKGKAADLFATTVNKRMAGRVKVEVFPSSQLYDDDKVIEAMRLSDSPTTGLMAAPSLSKFVKFSKTIQAFDLPYLFESVEDVHKLADSPVAEKMVGPLAKRGIKGLGFWDNGMKVFSIRGESPLINVPGDFKGKKFRIQSSAVHEAMIKDLGGIPQKLPFKEVYTSLAQGVVDGQENSWSNIYSKKFFEAQDWITVSNHSYLGYLIVVSAEFWDGLPGDVRAELTAILKEVSVEAQKFAAEDALVDRKKIEESGKVKIVDLTPEQRAQWKKGCAGVEKEFAREIGQDLLNDIHTLLGR